MDSKYPQFKFFSRTLEHSQCELPPDDRSEFAAAPKALLGQNSWDPLSFVTCRTWCGFRGQESVAHKGDTIKDMAHSGGQFEEFARRLEKALSHDYLFPVMPIRRYNGTGWRSLGKRIVANITSDNLLISVELRRDS